MIKPSFKRNWNGVPIIKDKEIDVIVEQIITQYNPKLLTNPQAIDIDDFALYYLNLKQDFKFLSHCGCIWGMMVFNDTRKVPVYNPELELAEYIEAEEGTIIIDNTLLDDSTEYRYRSTMAHECGHWIFHKDMFIVNEMQSSLFDEPRELAIACRSKDIEGQSGRRLVTTNDWIEHHAKYFSAALLMPKSLMEIACHEAKQNGLVTTNEALIRYISRIFEVSPTSARIRIQQLGLGISNVAVMNRNLFNWNDLPSRFELIEDF
ncbi:MAG: ImmA/IrrE family metallo-endopeptidase [Cellulosilyticum sp.]|nr:ImmA/IrrE family metallo-endopeptidase [Cellulosilyticum sp.]